MVRKVVTTYKVMSFKDFLSKVLRFVYTRLELFLIKFQPLKKQATVIEKILGYQSNDKFSLEFNGFISIMILQTRPEVIVVPNFLKSVFKLTFGTIIDAKIVSYADLRNSSEILTSNSLVILHDPMVNQLSKVKNQLTSFHPVFQIPSYSVIINFTHKDYATLEGYSNLLHQVEYSINKYKEINTFGYKFITRVGTMDEGIISEVNDEYFSWIKRELSGKKLNSWIDLGGHIGIFSIMMSSFAENGYVFEPMPENFDLIQKNINLNNLSKRIKEFPLAVSDNVGKATLHISADNTGGNRLHIGDPSSTESVEVEVTTLEKIFADNHIDSLDFLKVDVEGSEQKILFSSKEILQLKVKYIICEAGGSLSGDGEDVLNFLKEIGFEVEFQGNAGLMVIYAKNKKLLNLS